MPDTLIVYIAVGVAQVLSILGGGLMVAYRLGLSTRSVEAAVEVQALISKQNSEAIRDLRVDVSGVRNDVNEVRRLMAEVAAQKSAIDRLERWYDELRHGIGLVNGKNL